MLIIVTITISILYAIKLTLSNVKSLVPNHALRKWQNQHLNASLLASPGAPCSLYSITGLPQHSPATWLRRESLLLPPPASPQAHPLWRVWQPWLTSWERLLLPRGLGSWYFFPTLSSLPGFPPLELSSNSTFSGGLFWPEVSPPHPPNQAQFPLSFLLVSHTFHSLAFITFKIISAIICWMSVSTTTSMRQGLCLSV